METTVNRTENICLINFNTSLKTLYPRYIPTTVDILAPQAPMSHAITPRASNSPQILC